MSHTKSKTPFDTVIIRLGGEIGIKSAWTRRTYERRLIQNIKATLKHHNIDFEAVYRQQGRIFIKTGQAQGSVKKLVRVFGISSLSPASQATSKLEDITLQSLSLTKQKLNEGTSFAVKCKRIGTHPYTSRDICQHIGQKMLQAFPKLGLKVDLTNPDISIGVEIRQEAAYIYTDTIAASDGFPVGTQPNVVGLIKPDPNSPVACWLTMKRGCPLTPVYFSENRNKKTIRLVKSICKALFEWSIGHPTKLYIIPHDQNLITLKQECPTHLVSVIDKRLIYSIAEQVTEKERAEAIVTGETLREKPRQTLRRFKLQDKAMQNYPIHRPLSGLTRDEIKNLAQKIRIQVALTTEPKKREAIKPREAILPTLKEVEAAEDKLNIREMINTTLQKVEAVTI